MYFPVGFVNPIPKTTLSFTGSSVDVSNVTVGNSYTFSSMALGAADGNRWIILATLHGDGLNSSCSAVSVAGISASLVYRSTAGIRTIEFWAAHVPSGTTGNVVATIATATCTRLWVGTYRMLTKTTPTTAYDSVTDATLTAGHNDITINIPKDGVVIAGCVGSTTSAPSITWTGLTEDFDTPPSDASSTQTGSCAGGTNTFSTAQTAYAIQTLIITVPNDGLLAAVSFK